jgi:hypothetical protein
VGGRLAVRSGVGLRADMRGSVMRLDMGSSAIRSGNLRAIVHRDSCKGSRLLRMTVRLRIGVGRQVLRSLLVASSVILPVAIVPTSWMRHVRDHLHTTRHGTSRATTSRSIGRGSWAAKPLIQLLQEGAANIVSRNMNGVRNTHDDKRPLRRQGEASIRGIKPGA